MDEKRTDLKEALRELAAERSGDAGPHVGLERLIAYREGTLPAAEREALQEHLSLCAQCTGLLRELRDFEAASAETRATGPESLRQEAWESLLRSLQAPPLRRVPRFLYGLAATLLLAVFGLSAWAAVTVQREHRRLALLDQRLGEREEALAAAGRQLAALRRQIQDLEKEKVERRPVVEELETRVAQLTSELEKLRRTRQAPEGHDRLARAIELSVAPRFALRGQELPDSGFLRGGGTVNPVRIASQGDRFTVALSLADHVVYDDYRLELVDRDGKVLWAGRRPGNSLLGDTGTSVSVNGLGPGRYRLRIEGLHPDRSELLAEYVLAVEHPTQK